MHMLPVTNQVRSTTLAVEIAKPKQPLVMAVDRFDFENDPELLKKFAKSDQVYAQKALGIQVLEGDLSEIPASLQDMADLFLLSEIPEKPVAPWRSPEVMASFTKGVRDGSLIGGLGGIGGVVFGGGIAVCMSGVFTAGFKGFVGGILGGMFGGGCVGLDFAAREENGWDVVSGLSAGAGVAASVSYGIASSSWPTAVFGALASFALCMGISIANNTIPAFAKARREYPEQLAEYQKAQAERAEFDSHVGNDVIIRQELEKNSELRAHFIKTTVLPEIQRRKSAIEEEMAPHQRFLECYEEELAKIKSRLKENKTVMAETISEFITDKAWHEVEWLRLQETLSFLERELLSFERQIHE